MSKDAEASQNTPYLEEDDMDAPVAIRQHTKNENDTEPGYMTTRREMEKEEEEIRASTAGPQPGEKRKRGD